MTSTSPPELLELARALARDAAREEIARRKQLERSDHDASRDLRALFHRQTI